MLNGQDKITKKSFSVDAERSGQIPKKVSVHP